MSITARYVRRNSNVEAVRVNTVDLYQIVKWTKGEVLGVDAYGAGAVYVRVPVVTTKFRRANNQAFIGDWIVKDNDGFKIYSNDAFNRIFRPYVKNAEQYVKVLELVRQAMLERDSEIDDEYDTTLVAKEYAQKIVDLI